MINYKRCVVIVIAVLGLLNHNTVFAQSKSDRKPWVDGTFPKNRNNSEYRITVGDASTLDEARKIAFNAFIAQVESEAGVEVSSQAFLEISSIMDGNDLRESQKYLKSTFIKGKEVSIAFAKVDEHYEWDRGRYHIWVLYEVNKRAEKFEPLIPQYSDNYGMVAGWRSAVAPGWGQFYKKKTGKGVFFLTTEVVAISGIVFCEMKRSDNMRKSKETTNLTIIREYRSRADDWELIRNATIGVAAGVYVWNILDAALAKGKIRYAWMPDINTTTNEGYYGIAVKF